MTSRHHDRQAETYQAVTRLFQETDNFLLLTHQYPDGDALGSILALGAGLRSLGKQVTMFADGLIPDIYGFLPGLADLAQDPGRLDSYQVVVLIDCHNLIRAGDRVLLSGTASLLAVIDHHLVEEELPHFAIVDNRAAASGEIVFHVLKKLGVEITKDMAINLFVAISTDTGSFSFENTSPGALEVAAALVAAGASPWDIFRHLNFNRSAARMALLGRALSGLEYFHQGQVGIVTITKDMMAATATTEADTDGFVEYPRWVKGVELAILLREISPRSCKVSLRSVGRVNAAALAQAFGGGGHYQAAGFVMDEPYDRVKRLLVKSVAAYLPHAETGSPT